MLALLSCNEVTERSSSFSLYAVLCVGEFGELSIDNEIILIVFKL